MERVVIIHQRGRRHAIHVCLLIFDSESKSLLPIILPSCHWCYKDLEHDGIHSTRLITVMWGRANQVDDVSAWKEGLWSVVTQRIEMPIALFRARLGPIAFESDTVTVLASTTIGRWYRHRSTICPEPCSVSMCDYLSGETVTAAST